MDTVLIYKTEMLPISETFIQAQAASLLTFLPRFAGLKRARNSLTLPAGTILVTYHEGAIAAIGIHLYRLLGVAPRFLQNLKSIGPVLIHSHFATESVTALPIARHLKIPLIVTLHGADVTVHDSVLARSMGGRLALHRRAKLWREVSMFLCVSEFIRRKAIASGFPEEKLRVHYIGIDRSRFVPSEEKTNKDTVLFVGRLTEKKGCRYLLQAMAIVQETCPAARLTVIGDGPLRQSLETLASELKVACTFLGAQSAETVRNHLASTAVFCVPSVTAANGDSEGLGMVFAEAQATGVPVVSFSHGGIPEVVLHGETGLLCLERDYKQLAQNIVAYLKDDSLRRHSAMRGISWVAQRFDIVTQTAELERIYSQVIADYSRRNILE